MSDSAMRFDLDTRGFERDLTRLGNLQDDFLNAIGESFMTEATLLMGTSPPGREYKRGAERVHVASQPGYPPNVDTGNLQSSLSYDVRGDVVEIHGAEYAIHLEFGRDEEGATARPFIEPAVDNIDAQSIIAAIIEDAV